MDHLNLLLAAYHILPPVFKFDKDTLVPVAVISEVGADNYIIEITPIS